MGKPLLLATVSALAAHLLIGWMWSPIGAVIGGYLAVRRGWLIGASGIVIAWAAIILFRYIQAPYQVSEMTRVVSGLVGEFPPATTYGLSLLVAALLGLLGGAAGQSLAALQKPSR